jgi:hypothetical protein
MLTPSLIKYKSDDEVEKFAFLKGTNIILSEIACIKNEKKIA